MIINCKYVCVRFNLNLVAILANYACSENKIHIEHEQNRSIKIK